MKTIRIETETKENSPRENHLLQYLNNELNGAIKKLKIRSFYHIQSDQDIQPDDLNDIFCDPICENIYDSDSNVIYNFAFNISYRPGVTDNIAKSSKDALKLYGYESNVSSGTVILIEGTINSESVTNLLNNEYLNPLIQKIECWQCPEINCRFDNREVVHVEIVDSKNLVEQINLDISDKELLILNQKRCLALNLDEIYQARDHFKTRPTERSAMGLPSNHPTDVEIEVIAQTWSEHCKHKIFSSKINYSEENSKFKKINDKTIHSLYKTYIKDTTNKIMNEKNWCISVFSDNAGVVRFDEQVDFTIKVETHNSPSALDPYGGAITGILGVNRDILGVGLGSRPIANTNVFCFPNIVTKNTNEGKLPNGPRHPNELIRGVHKGVEDGGNKSGIPTVNGAFYFDDSFSGKPLVYCGTIGVMPQKINELDTSKKYTKPGDFIYMAGGKVGADGIHGATFSSLQLDEHAPATAVQIGDPITQKRLSDFLLAARDQLLFTGVTDNGAGGLSSSVGEMATITNGARIDLKKVPLKYTGLKPFEILISESQERMTFSVDPTKTSPFERLAKEYGVDVSNLGEFTNNGDFEIFHGETCVGKIDLKFLHEELKPLELEAKWNQTNQEVGWGDDRPNPIQKEPIQDVEKTLKIALLKILNRPNISSKENFIRRYDHEVQAATHVKPFSSETFSSPNDSGLIWTYPHGGSKETAIGVSCGLAPRLSEIDPYEMALYSLDEAVANLVSQGVDPDVICALDNFCWPDPVNTPQNPKGKFRLAQLVRSCEGLAHGCLSYKIPLVSGKDSMKNNFSGLNRDGVSIKFGVLPTLLITAMGKATMGKTMGSSYKNYGDRIAVVGVPPKGLLGSEFAEIFEINQKDQVLEGVNLERNLSLYRQIYHLIQQQHLQSCHDVSEGGLFVALCEPCFTKNLGADLTLSEIDSSEENIFEYLFSEARGRFVISYQKDKEQILSEYLKDHDFTPLGDITQESNFIIKNSSSILLEHTVQDINEIWNKFQKDIL